ncbi:putative reverse transcriptase domain-containing protein [Tanacetum coccineum]
MSSSSSSSISSSSSSEMTITSSHMGYSSKCLSMYAVGFCTYGSLDQEALRASESIERRDETEIEECGDESFQHIYVSIDMKLCVGSDVINLWQDSTAIDKAEAIEKEDEVVYTGEDDEAKEIATERFSKLLENNRIPLDIQENISMEAANGLIMKLENELDVTFLLVRGRAQPWWNGNASDIGHANANQIPWSNVKAMMTTEYCPSTEIQKMEQELWTLTLKGDDIEAYTNRFYELVLMCPELVPTKKKKIE